MNGVRPVRQKEKAGKTVLGHLGDYGLSSPWDTQHNRPMELALESHSLGLLQFYSKQGRAILPKPGKNSLIHCESMKMSKRLLGLLCLRIL